jgi:hypothetical protein
MAPGVGHNSASIASTASSSSETVKFEQKRVTSASKTKVVTDGFSSQQATANSTEMKRLQTGEMSYQEQSTAAAVRARLEMDGVSAEKSMALKQVSGHAHLGVRSNALGATAAPLSLFVACLTTLVQLPRSSNMGSWT